MAKIPPTDCVKCVYEFIFEGEDIVGYEQVRVCEEHSKSPPRSQLPITHSIAPKGAKARGVKKRDGLELGKSWFK